MLTKRIIPCLDVDAGRVVKGVNFVGLRDAGDPVSVAKCYADEGADELVFLDITASSSKRESTFSMIEQVANQVFIPFTVGGGVRTVADVQRLLNAGADKVSINSAALQNPQLVADASNYYGSQCIVVAVDAKRDSKDHALVYSHGGRQATNWEVLDWVKKVVSLGAGEILLTSMDADGMQQGFDIALTRQVSDAISVPVIASGGVGTLVHFYEGITKGGADAVLAASVFHFDTLSIRDVKDYLLKKGIAIRPCD